MTSEDDRKKRRSRSATQRDADYERARSEWQRTHAESVAEERHALEDADRDFDPASLPEWSLDSPLAVRNVQVGNYVLDVVVRHSIQPGPMTEANRPEVVTISNLARFDGEPLGARAVRIDLRTVAVDAVIWHLGSVVELRPGPVLVGAGAKDWRVQARVVRSLVATFDPGRRPTRTQDDWLMAVWREIRDIGPGIQKDLAEELGVEVEWLSNRLWKLREKFGRENVPRGLPGNPWKRKDEQ